ncbi:MAG: 30S ribosomal protein S17 [Patescibacteria group bacterium]
MIARVIAKKLEKSVTVLVERQSLHPLYKKAFIRSKKYLVEDPIGVKMGDLIEIIKVAPISKRKHFKVIKVLGKRLDEIMEEKLKEQTKDIIDEIMPDQRLQEEKKENGAA